MCETGYMCEHFDTDKLKRKSHRILVTCIRSHNELVVEMGLETPFNYSALC